ncbi:hypothetical protein MCAV_02150 [[Mycoplasma] cavipharyngis]|uniref:hypothetical protein n=1 Tax=[Mycoplasma] cavipharyngis TaxID=92757 RepID=UPI003703D328
MKLKGFFKFNRKLRIGLLISLLSGVIGGSVGTVIGFSPQIFNYYSAIQAGYDQNFQVPIFENKYQKFSTQQQNHLQIIQTPNLNAKQSLDLDQNKFTTLKNQKVVEFNLSSKNNNLSEQTKEVFHAKFSKEQFIEQFLNRYDPDLGFLFNLQFATNSNESKEDLKFDYQNLITGFSLNDLSLVKSRTYKIFDYALNDDFINLTGKITAYLNINIDRRGQFETKISLVGSDLKNHSLNANNNDKLKLNFSAENTDAAFKPIVFWNNNQTNNLSDWFWPIPKGPQQSEKVKLPKSENSSIVENNQYTTTYINNGLIEKRYTAVNNLEDNDNIIQKSQTDNNQLPSNQNADQNTGFKVDETQFGEKLVSLKFTHSQWQTNFFNHWKDAIPTNPGIQIKFDLLLNLLDAEYGQKQEYKNSYFGYFDFSNLKGISYYHQNIISYDLSQGRHNNQGIFKVNLFARVDLKGELTIGLYGKVDHLNYLKSNNSNDISADQFKLNSKISNIEVNRFQKGIDNKLELKQEDIRAVNRFNRDVSSGKTEVYTQINKALNRTDRDGRQARKWDWWSIDPYLFHYNTKWSNWSTENIASYVENQKEFADQVKIKFNFTGLSATNNRTNVILDNPRGVKGVLIWGNKGVNLGSNEKNYQPYNPNNVNDDYNSFEIPFNNLIKGKNQHYTLKKMYAYQNNNDGWQNFDRNIFNFQNTAKNKNWSAMRVRFYLQLERIDDFSYKYRIGMDASTYQWRKDNTGASKGRAGFKINNINYVINNESFFNK